MYSVTRLQEVISTIFAGAKWNDSFLIFGLLRADKSKANMFLRLFARKLSRDYWLSVNYWVVIGTAAAATWHVVKMLSWADKPLHLCSVCVHLVLLDSICTVCSVWCSCSWTWWWLYRLCSNQVVSKSRTVGRRHSVWSTCRYLGYRLCVLWTHDWTTIVAWKIWCWSALPDS